MKLSKWHGQRLATDRNYAPAARDVDLSQSIADLVVDARVRANWTQKDLARRATLTQSQISQLESGVDNPTIGTVEKAINALQRVVETEVVRIFDGAPRSPRDKPPAPSLKDLREGQIPRKGTRVF